MAKQRSKPVTQMLWSADVRHRDYVNTANSRRICMTYSKLFILVKQPEASKPSIDKAMARTRSFLRRNQREYGLATIRGVEFLGTIDG